MTHGEAILSASVVQERHDEARSQAAARSATLATAQTDLARVDGKLIGLERHLEEARGTLNGQLPDEDFTVSRPLSSLSFAGFSVDGSARPYCLASEGQPMTRQL